MQLSHRRFPPEARMAVHRAVSELAADVVDVVTRGGAPSETQLWSALPASQHDLYDWPMLLRFHALLGGIGRALVFGDDVPATNLAEQLLLDIVLRRAADDTGDEGAWADELRDRWLPDVDHELLYDHDDPLDTTVHIAAAQELLDATRNFDDLAALKDWFSSAPYQFQVLWGNPAVVRGGDAVPDGPLRVVDAADYPTGGALAAASDAGAALARDLAVQLLSGDAGDDPLGATAWTDVDGRSTAQRLLLGLGQIAYTLHHVPVDEDLELLHDTAATVVAVARDAAGGGTGELTAPPPPLNPDDRTLLEASIRGAIHGLDVADAQAAFWDAPTLTPSRLAAAAAVAAATLAEFDAREAGQPLLIQIAYGNLTPADALRHLRT